jgi:autotransporter translocation and assembly factor TamB
VASRYEDIFKADDIDLDLTFAGAASGSKLAGRIRLDQPRSEPTLVVFNAPPVPPPPPALRDDFLENMALAVELDLRDLVLDSELVEIGASGAVEIGGTFYKPLFQGDMAIDEGRIYLLNQQFEFESGRVVFNSLEPTGSILDVAYDPLELDPELDLRATTQVQDIQDDEEYVVTLRLQGRAREVVPQFTSEPPRDFPSIINLLAFNTVSNQNIDYTTALGTVAGQLLSSRVERAGLDEFAVLPSSTLVGALPGDPAIRVGKYFSGLPLPLWVRYEALLKEMSSGEVRIEHKLKSFLTITGSAQSEYDRYGLGIGVKKKF